MPAIKVITPIMGGRYYHLFNRGNNGQQVFFNEENYKYFLRNFISFSILMSICWHIVYPFLNPNEGFDRIEKDSIFKKNDGIPNRRSCNWKICN